MKNYLLLLVIFLLAIGCKQSNPEISFYYWKSNVEWSQPTADLLELTQPKDLYLHFFDVDRQKQPKHYDDGLYPSYTLAHIDSVFLDYNLIPVIYIVNSSLKTADINQLASNIQKLTEQISTHHELAAPREIQLDCDWNASTQKAFFSLVDKLTDTYKVSATIRLHQIKYHEKTGVPPAHKGVLMLYNMGDLKNQNENSILSLKVVKEYINTNTTYPLPLDLALPGFSQTVILNPNGQVKLINTSEKLNLKQSNGFDQLSDNIFKPKRDTLYKGFYINSGFRLKTETPDVDEIIASYKFLKKSKLNLSDKVILYHLDNNPETVVYMKNIINGL